LSPSQKYEIWLQLIRGEMTMVEAADRWGVDRSTIMRIRAVAKDGALQALAESKPDVQAKQRDVGLDAARAEAARLGEALKELAVRLRLVEGKGVGAKWPGPRSGGCGRQGRAAGLDRAGHRGGLDGAGRLPGAGAR
jgi:transposase